MVVALPGSQMITQNSAIAATRNQISAELGEDTVILHLTNGMYYSLNPVGARIWALLATPIPYPDLRDHILAEYEVDEERCEKDLMDLLAELEAESLVEV